MRTTYVLMTGSTWLRTITTPDIVDKYLNHGQSSPMETRSPLHSGQMVSRHGLDSWQFGLPQLNLQHIPLHHPLVVKTVPSRFFMLTNYLILAQVLMETNHGVPPINHSIRLTRGPISLL